MSTTLRMFAIAPLPRVLPEPGTTASRTQHLVFRLYSVGRLAGPPPRGIHNANSSAAAIYAAAPRVKINPLAFAREHDSSEATSQRHDSLFAVPQAPRGARPLALRKKPSSSIPTRTVAATDR